MAGSRSRRRFGAKLGAATALVALGTLPAVSAEAAPAVLSDTLQVGTQTPSQLFESSEPGSIMQSTTITEPGQTITGSRTIVLTDPGGSDIVMATISAVEVGFSLTVTLTSGETPFPPPASSFETITETGGVQDLSGDFTSLFDLNTALPAINVMSVVDGAVPEPGSLALLGAGLAGLALGRRRKR